MGHRCKGVWLVWQGPLYRVQGPSGAVCSCPVVVKSPADSSQPPLLLRLALVEACCREIMQAPTGSPQPSVMGVFFTQVMIFLHVFL